jgi:hypothetical protein
MQGVGTKIALVSLAFSGLLLAACHDKPEIPPPAPLSSLTTPSSDSTSAPVPSAVTPEPSGISPEPETSITAPTTPLFVPPNTG